MNKNQIGTCYIIASATGFGLMSIFALYAYEAGANVVTVLFFRFFFASIYMWGYWLYQKSFPTVLKKELLYLLGLGVIGYGIMSGLFFSSLNYIPASLSAMLLYTYPGIVTLLAVMLKDEKFELQKGAALGLSFIGLIMILGTSFNKENSLGIILGLGAAVFYSGYIIVSNRVLKKVQFWIASTYVITSATIMYAIFGISTNNINIHIAGSGWLAILAIAILSTIVAISCFFAGINLIGPSRASIISTFEPIVTVIAASILFKENLTVYQLVGGLFILLSVILLQLYKKGDSNDKIKAKL